MANYLFLSKAIEDLSNIWNYTFDEWSEKQADKYYNLLLQCCEEIANKKVSGKMYPEIEEDILGFRIAEHVIFYRQLDSKKMEVVRILHGSMDLKNKITEI